MKYQKKRDRSEFSKQFDGYFVSVVLMHPLFCQNIVQWFCMARSHSLKCTRSSTSVHYPREVRCNFFPYIWNQIKSHLRQLKIYISVFHRRPPPKIRPPRIFFWSSEVNRKPKIGSHDALWNERAVNQPIHSCVGSWKCSTFKANWTIG